MKLAFFDTETTSEKDGRLVQLGILCEDGSGLTDTYKPPVPIDYEAMAVHHITQEMADRHGPFDDDQKAFVRNLLAGRIPVAHNAAFDVAVMKREGIDIPEYICTLKVARRLWPEWPSHKLQYLRYRLGVQVATGPAHDAMADAKVLEAVFAELWLAWDKKWPRTEPMPVCDPPYTREQEIIDEMLHATTEPTLLHAIGFGKHKGRTFEDLAKNERGYLDWLAKQDDLDDDLRHTLGHHRGQLL